MGQKKGTILLVLYSFTISTGFYLLPLVQLLVPALLDLGLRVQRLEVLVREVEDAHGRLGPLQLVVQRDQLLEQVDEGLVLLLGRHGRDGGGPAWQGGAAAWSATYAADTVAVIYWWEMSWHG